MSSIDLSSRYKLAGVIREKAKAHFNIDPLLVPMPPGLPPELPQLVFTNEPEGWQLQIGPARFDVVWDTKKLPDVPPLDVAFADIRTTLLQIYDALVPFGARIHRLGVVIAFDSEGTAPHELLRKKHLKGTPTPDPEEVRYMFLQKLEAGTFRLNQWTRLISYSSPPHLVVEVDINTIQESPLDVDEKTITSFLAEVMNLIGKGLEVYA